MPCTKNIQNCEKPESLSHEGNFLEDYKSDIDPLTETLIRIILQNMEVIASRVLDLTFGILCLAKSKKKRSIKNLRIIWTTGLVWNGNSTCALF